VGYRERFVIRANDGGTIGRSGNSVWPPCVWSKAGGRECRALSASTSRPLNVQFHLPPAFFQFKLSVVQPKPESLDDLLVNAGHYAGFAMRNLGRLPPALFLIGANGPLMFIPENLADARAKDDFATTARLLCIAHAATAVVMALEVWMTCAKPGEKFDATEPPSEAFDRQEVVILMGESRDGPKQKFLPIIRSGNGKFFGFGESDVPGVDQMKGRFAQILPPNVVDEQTRLVAGAVLTVRGLTPAKIRSGSKLPRFRT
jgi:hypothetical protein